MNVVTSIFDLIAVLAVIAGAFLIHIGLGVIATGVAIGLCSYALASKPRISKETARNA